MKKTLCALGAIVSLFAASRAEAAVTITPATGGTNISSSTAADLPSAAWTSLGAITISEGGLGKGDFQAGAGKTLVLNAPAGFEFNSTVTPTVSVNPNKDISSASASITSTAITVTFTVTGTGAVDHMDISGIQVRPTSSITSTSGNIYRPVTGGGTASITGIVATDSADGSGGTNFGILRVTASQPQTITFDPISDKTFGDPDFSLTATASSGLPVTFTVVSGPAEISNGTNVTLTGAGFVTIRASQSGNATYAAAQDVIQPFTVNQAAQTITFDPISDKTFGDAPFTVSATSSSELPVTFSVVSGSAIVSGNEVTLTGAGPVTIRASQGGDANYLAAEDKEQSFDVAKKDQTISFDPITPKNPGDVFNVTATASSGLPVEFSITGPATISGSEITVTGAGTILVRASQSGNEDYNPAPDQEQSFDSGKLDQTISFDTISDKSEGDVFNVTATASSGLPVEFSITGPATISGSEVTVTGGGTVVVRASQPGNDIYNAAPDQEQTFFSKAAQTITFDLPADVNYTNEPFTLTATASSGLPVTLEVLTGPVTVSNNVITITGVGEVTLRASQTGDDTYSAAKNVEQTFNILPGSLVVTANDATRSVGSANPTFTGSISGLKAGDNITADFQTTADSNSAVGTYPITVSLNDPDGKLVNYTVTTNNGTLTIADVQSLAIITQPTGTEVKQGAFVSFTVAAVGNGTLTYQWRHNGTDIEGATNATFAIGFARVQDSGDYDVVVADSVTAIASTGVTLNVIFVPADFDGNGQSEIILQKDDGSIGAWFMDGTNILSGGLFRDGAKVASGWKLVSQNDFTGDFQTDLLFENADGRVAVWILEGTTYSGATLLRDGQALIHGWNVVGSGDFDGNGSTEILLQNKDGRLAQWKMNGTTFESSTFLYPYGSDTPVPALEAGWHVVGARDFSGDRRADILLRNDDGRLQLWLMDGNSVLTTHDLRNGPTVESGWNIVGLNDFNGDNNTDILWQHADGRVAVWSMQGTDFVSSAVIRTIPSVWHIAGPK